MKNDTRRDTQEQQHNTQAIKLMLALMAAPVTTTNKQSGKPA